MEVAVFPRVVGVQWSNTVESTLWGMALGVAIVLATPVGGVVVAVGRTALQMWRSVGPAGQDLVYSSGGGARGGPGPPGRSAVVHTRRSGRHVEVPDPSRGEVRDSGCE